MLIHILGIIYPDQESRIPTEELRSILHRWQNRFSIHLPQHYPNGGLGVR